MRDSHKHAQITFDAPDRPDVTCLIDSPGASVDSASYGGWEVKSRPQRVGLVSWKGSDPMVLNVPLLFDNTDTGKSLEGDILNLEGIAGRGPQGGDGPVPFKVSTLEGFGSLVPHNFNGESLDWVISTLEWGEFQRRPRQTDGSGGHRVQQHATLQLTQYVTDKRLVQLSASKRANAHGRRRKTTKVKSGDTLQKISRREYGTSDRWQDIAILNKIRDPRHPGKVGKTLKLPR